MKIGLTSHQHLDLMKTGASVESRNSGESNLRTLERHNKETPEASKSVNSVDVSASVSVQSEQCLHYCNSNNAMRLQGVWGTFLS